MKTYDLSAALRVYVILDPEKLREDTSLMDVAQQVLQAGARVIQLRNKRDSARTTITQARQLVTLCEQYDALFIMNDRVDLALAVHAHGVHVGPEDMPVDLVKEIAPDLIVGASSGSVESALDNVQRGADYLGVGAIFEARQSKPDASAPRGLQVVRDIREALGSAFPFVGIGGITRDNARSVVDAGADGVAMIRAITAQADPAHEVGVLIHALDD